MQFKSITQKIIKAAFVVHNHLGVGFAEKIYQLSFAHEMSLSGLTVSIEKPIKVYYKEKMVGEYYADLVVFDQIILETKCVSKIIYPHIDQLKNYLTATKYPLGLVFNFKNQQVDFTRVYPY